MTSSTISSAKVVDPTSQDLGQKVSVGPDRSGFGTLPNFDITQLIAVRKALAPQSEINVPEIVGLAAQGVIDAVEASRRAEMVRREQERPKINEQIRATQVEIASLLRIKSSIPTPQYGSPSSSEGELNQRIATEQLELQKLKTS
jgi:hypothetical protein